MAADALVMQETTMILIMQIMSYSMKDFNYLHNLSVEKWEKMQHD